MLKYFTRKPKNRFSVEHLLYLVNQLEKNKTIKDANKKLVIETLREIAELMIWGDQHDTIFFEVFLEKDILKYFLSIMTQTTGKEVKIQLLQTLSILVENLKRQTSIYFLLSNNHINELIIHQFDFSDEEVLAYYISFLKTLSLKLNPSTLQFFFNQDKNDFPLYTEALKFFAHPDSMVRISVRSITLNVYKVEDEAMRTFIFDKAAVPYFSNIVWFIGDQCTTLDELVISSNHQSFNRLQGVVDELLDVFYYINDIINLGIASLNDVLVEQMLAHLLIPLFRGSLLLDDALEDRISPPLALFLLSQVLHIFTHKTLVNVLGGALVHPQPHAYVTDFLTGLTGTVTTPHTTSLSTSSSEEADIGSQSALPTKRVSLSSGTTADPAPFPGIPLYYTPCGLPEVERLTPSEKAAAEGVQGSGEAANSRGQRHIYILHLDPPPARNRHRDALLLFLEDKDDRMCLGVLTVLYALVSNSGTDKQLLHASGLFPSRLSKAKALLEALVSDGEAGTTSLDACWSDANSNSLSLFTDETEVSDNEEGLEEEVSFRTATVVKRPVGGFDPPKDGGECACTTAVPAVQSTADKEREEVAEPADGPTMESGSLETKRIEKGVEPKEAEVKLSEGDTTAATGKGNWEESGCKSGDETHGGGGAANLDTAEAVEARPSYGDSAAPAPEGPEAGETAANEGSDISEGKEGGGGPENIQGTEKEGVSDERELGAEEMEGEGEEAMDKEGTKTDARAGQQRMIHELVSTPLAVEETFADGEDRGSGCEAKEEEDGNEHSDDGPGSFGVGVETEEGNGGMNSTSKDGEEGVIFKTIGGSATGRNRGDTNRLRNRLAYKVVVEAAQSDGGGSSEPLPGENENEGSPHAAADEGEKTTEKERKRKIRTAISLWVGERITPRSSRRSSKEEGEPPNLASPSRSARKARHRKRDTAPKPQSGEQVGDGKTRALPPSASGTYLLKTSAPRSRTGRKRASHRRNVSMVSMQEIGQGVIVAQQPYVFESGSLRHGLAARRGPLRSYRNRNRAKGRGRAKSRLPAVQSWVTASLALIAEAHRYRFVTIQLATTFLRELLCSAHEVRSLTTPEKALLLSAYERAISNAKKRLNGSLGGKFLTMFQAEYRRTRALNFGHLVTDPALCFSVSEVAKMSNLDLEKRLPRGEAEKTRRAIQTFLIVRELRYALLSRRDGLLPLKEGPSSGLAVGDSVEAHAAVLEGSVEGRRVMDKEDVANSVGASCQLLIKGTELVVFEEAVAEGEVEETTFPSRQSSSPPRALALAKAPAKPGLGVAFVFPLSGIDVSSSPDIELLTLRSGYTILHFQLSADCAIEEERIEQARNAIFDDMLRQVMYLLVESDACLPLHQAPSSELARPNNEKGLPRLYNLGLCNLASEWSKDEQKACRLERTPAQPRGKDKAI